MDKNNDLLNFSHELYELCQKYKRNVEVKIESDDVDHERYEITINGAWPIRSDESAVDVFQIPREKHLFSINGTKQQH